MVSVNISHDDLSPVEVSVDYDFAPSMMTRYTVYVFGEEVFQSDWEDRGYGWDPEEVEQEWKGKWRTFQVAKFKGWLDATQGVQCPYTHAHTKHWCGYEGCRES